MSAPSWLEVRQVAARALGRPVPSHEDVAVTLVDLAARLEAAEALPGLEAVLAKHWPVPVFGCECRTVAELADDDGRSPHLDESWEGHVAALIRNHSKES